MKKKISIILLLFTIFLSSITYVDEVWGDDYVADVKSTDSGGTSGCSGGNCYTLGTSGARFTLVDENGVKVPNTKTVDLWYYSNQGNTALKRYLTEENSLTVFFRDNSASSGYDLTRQKLYHYGSVLDSSMIYIGNDDKVPYTMSSIENVFPGILSEMTNQHSNEIGSECTGNIYCRAADKKNTRIPNATETIMLEITKNASKDSSYMDILYERMGATGKVKEEYYLQVEPLVQWGNFNLPGDNKTCSTSPTKDNCPIMNRSTSFIFFGTTSELSLIFYSVANGKMANGMFCINSSSLNGTCNGSLNYSAFNPVNGYMKVSGSTNFYNFASFGIYTPKEKGEGGEILQTTPGGIFERLDSENIKLVNQKAYENVTSDTTNSKAYGVGFISLKEIVNKSCHDEADTILRNEYPGRVDDNKFLKSGKNFNGIEARLCDSSKNDNKEIRDNCCKDDGTIDADKCPQLTEKYLETVGTINNGDYCSVITCNSSINKINNILKDIESDLYKNVIGYFNGYFNKEEDAPTEPGLSYEIWHDFFGTKAKCGVEIPDCSPQKLETSCATTPSFTLKDSGELEKCIKFGFAYNDGPTGSLEASKDDEYSFEGKPGYCYEEVSFNFPQGGKTVTAGTVLKWRISNLSSIDNLFGTMTVYRKCFIPDGLENGHVITSNWANVSGTEQFAIANGRINPKVYLKYQQPITGSTEISSQLSVYLHKFESYAVKDNGQFFEDFNFVVYDKNGRAQEGIYTGSRYRGNVNISEEIERIENDGYYNGLDGNNPRQFTCPKAECNDINYVEMQATYNIVYNDNLKWYSDKNLNGELITIGDEGVQASYAFAGYGLPTSFPIADNVYCEGYGFDKKNNNAVGAYGKGKLDVIVEQVGTLGPKGYHFNKLISDSDLFIDDNESSNENIDYYCNYKVNNPLFDNEYSSEGAAMCDSSRTPKGIDVVFRTIDLISSKDELNKAFPGRSGLGYKEGEVGTRTMGANWYKFSDESIADLLGDNVYNQEPMYEITLDSPTIQKIREWNRAARLKDIDPYTDMGESKTSDASDDSYGFTGYEYYTITKNFDGEDHEYSFVASKFLEALDANFEHFKTNCIISVGNTFTRRENCNQSWWKEGLDKHTISMELRTPIGG